MTETAKFDIQSGTVEEKNQNIVPFLGIDFIFVHLVFMISVVFKILIVFFY